MAKLSILRYPDVPPGVEQSWGINFLRSVFRAQEETRWSYTPKSVHGLVSHFGHLEGLVDLPKPRRIEVMPFGLISSASPKAAMASSHFS